MTAILQFLSGAFSVPETVKQPVKTAEPQADRWLDHSEDLPAARDADAWIRADLIRAGRPA
ncbi:hypothetical protein [Microbaculum marinum]|uniref:Uncharacterized protein n=1 Tax=Microbaculum marinum TaxID=1764581 RepID=A0AAW9RNY1_9HYPH